MSGAIKEKTVSSSSAVMTGRGIYYGCRLTSVTAGRVIVYDNTAASGKIIDDIKAPSATQSRGRRQLPHGIAVVNGIFVDTSGTGARATVWYDSPEAA